jgi:hypothetical protein
MLPHLLVLPVTAADSCRMPPPQKKHTQDLVEVLSTPGIWWTAKQTDQRIALEEDGTYPLGYEETQPFEYHAGYLSVHFSARKYGVTGRELTPLQQEAVWWVSTASVWLYNSNQDGQRPLQDRMASLVQTRLLA